MRIRGRSDLRLQRNVGANLFDLLGRQPACEADHAAGFERTVMHDRAPRVAAAERAGTPHVGNHACRLRTGAVAAIAVHGVEQAAVVDLLVGEALLSAD